MASSHMNNKRYCLVGEPTDLYLKATFGTTGAPTIVTTNDASYGIQGMLQALASSGIYLISFNDPYVTTRGISANFSSLAAAHLPTAFGVVRLSEASAVGGGVAMISCASVVAGATKTVTIKKPGSAAVVLTAVAYNATPGDNEFCVGNTTGADNETANNLAALIRNDAADAGQGGKGDTNGNGGSTTMPSGITAYAVGAVVVISTTTRGWLIQTSDITTMMFKATGTGVANTAQVMQPGIVIGCCAATAATICPASGDAVSMEITLEKAQRSV